MNSDENNNQENKYKGIWRFLYPEYWINNSKDFVRGPGLQRDQHIHQSTEVDFQKSAADNKPCPLTGEEQHGCGRQSQEDEYN